MATLKRGRPSGSTKCPDRARIRNLNGRLIDVAGPQYCKLIRDGNTIENNIMFTGKNYIPKIMNYNGSMIDVNGSTYKQVLKNGYKLNEDKTQIVKDNTFVGERIVKRPRGRPPYVFITDPKNPFKSFTSATDPYKGYIGKGYIYDEKKNKLLVPSKKTEKAFKNEAVEYEFIVANSKDPVIQMKLLDQRKTHLLKKSLNILKGIKVSEFIEILFMKDAGENVIENKFTFTTKAATITREDQIENVLTNAREEIMRRIDRHQNGGSGWIVDEIIMHGLRINKYQPLSAKSYIPLPKEISNRKATINIQNKDNKCFMYCLGRALDPNPEKNNLERVSRHLKQVCVDLKLNQIVMPVEVKSLNKIEKEYNISINVFGHKGPDIYPIKLTETEAKSHVNLLFTSNEETNHYVWIKDFNKLCSRVTKYKCKKYFCMRCIQYFGTEEILKKHTENCSDINGVQAVELPKPNTQLQFCHLDRTVNIPFVIYADLESLLEVLNNETKQHSSCNTTKTHRHVACSYGYKVVCVDNEKYSKPYKTFRGVDAIHKFFESLFEEEEEIDKLMKQFKRTDMIITKIQKEEYQMTKACYVCDQAFTKDNRKVRDHCHVSGLYRGAACNTCNLQMKISHIIPVVFHNLRGYDSHLLMQELGKFKKNITVIPNNMEKYMSFSVGNVSTFYDMKKGKEVQRENFNLRFIDSFQFMASSLEQLVCDLKDGGLSMFSHTCKEFGKHAEMMTRKGIYPYVYMSSWDKFDINPSVLTMEDFTNDLTGEKIKDEDFQFFREVCLTFGIETLGEYHDLYLKSDVLLLADVFENFRRVCKEYYKLDPAHYYSSPGLSWDACLKMTNIKMDLISDIDKYLFIEKGIRGGISVITHRIGQGNNKYMKDYDMSKPTKYVTYLDANNLYGWGMSQYLPYAGFEWIDPENFKLSDVKEDSLMGYILEVDLEYPKHLHDLHNDYPLCPEHVIITKEMLSDYCKNTAAAHGLKHGKFTKLVPNLMNKKNYVIHYRNLQQAADAGLIITKIHRILQFKQKPWLLQYVIFNTNKRKEAKNNFTSNFFKLMVNSFYGKSVENLRKRTNVKLIVDEKKLCKYVSKPGFVSSKIFNPNLVAVHSLKEKLKLDKPIYLGFSILDLSKWLMNDFHYGFIKNKYGNNAQLLFTDTDSLCYEIKTDDFYKDMHDNKEFFDFSDMKGTKEYSGFNDNMNKKVIGKFKDETSGLPIKEFIGLRSKMYSVWLDNETEKKTAKGVVKSVIKKELSHATYKNILETSGKMYSNMKVIRSQKHQIYTMEIKKVSLSAYDDKRWIKDDGLSSLAYGHHMIS